MVTAAQEGREGRTKGLLVTHAVFAFTKEGCMGPYREEGSFPLWYVLPGRVIYLGLSFPEGWILPSF